MLSSYSWDNIGQVETLCNVIQEVPDNIAQENVLLNFALIPLWLYFTVETLCNVIQEVPDNIAQEKALINFVLILL